MTTPAQPRKLLTNAKGAPLQGRPTWAPKDLDRQAAPAFTSSRARTLQETTMSDQDKPGTVVCPDCHQTRPPLNLIHQCHGCVGCTVHAGDGTATPSQPDPAAQTHAAARLLREHASAARSVIPEPWTISNGPTDGGGVLYAENGWIVADRSCDEPDDSVDLPYIALMHPGVGEALAAWLEAAAGDFEMCERVNSRDPHNDGKTRIMPHHLAISALAAARALLGGQP